MKTLHRTLLATVLLILLPNCSQRDLAEKEALAILQATQIEGGIVVHLGCGDGRLTEGFASSDSFLVQGLDKDPANVQAARTRLLSVGKYGRISVNHFDGQHLPYIDNIVNLVVVENQEEVPTEELMRVLCPGGVAYVRDPSGWQKTVKPWPDEIDEWTHYLHDSTGNAVAHDSVVGPPRHLQWVGSPQWARHHDHMASMSAMVSSGGRVFYIFDEGSTASVLLPPKWFLIARDAFNGTLLWKRSISEWNTYLWPLKSGPAQLPRRLVAVDDKVYVTLGINAPVSVLDAATGNTLRTYEGTEYTEEIVTSEGFLLLQVNHSANKWTDYRPRYTYVWDNRDLANFEWAWDESPRTVLALEADTGNTLWKHDLKVSPLTLAANETRVLLHDGEKVRCFDLLKGDELWASAPVGRQTPISTGYAPTLVSYGDVVLFSGGLGSMSAISATNGELLWESEQAASGHWSPEDVMVIKGLVWSGATAFGRDSGVFTGRDLYTGEVRKEFPPDVKTYWFHQRCYPGKATERFILPSRTGVEFIDPEAEHWSINHWVRGGCIYGVMPSNGLLYAPAHSCACYIESKLNGFCALAPGNQSRSSRAPLPAGERLVKGPAFGSELGSVKADQEDWPTYRHDGARSGSSSTSISSELAQEWRTNLKGDLTSLVVASGKLFVAAKNRHTLYALDSSSGQVIWQHMAGGRIDSPPTFYQGRILFGSADGWVYCLRAEDGELVWRFRAAPDDLQVMSFEQLESVWPVHGSVLVKEGAVYCVAGRSMFLDGGLHLLRLDASSGNLLSETILDEIDPETGDNLQAKVSQLEMPVALPDILSSDDQYVYMRSQKFGLDGKRIGIGTFDVTQQEGEGAHLFSLTGFLDDSGFHRTYWMWGRTTSAGWGGWFRAGRYVPSGQIMVSAGDSLYGFGRKPEYLCQSSVNEYMLFRAGKELSDEAIQNVLEADKRIARKGGKRNSSAADWKLRQEFPLADQTAVGFDWISDRPSLHVRALVLADETLFVAGPPDVVNEEEVFFNLDSPKIKQQLVAQQAALEGRSGALLWSVSAVDGSKLSELTLDTPPVFDGMAAANQRLFVALQDGSVICLAGRR